MLKNNYQSELEILQGNTNSVSLEKYDIQISILQQNLDQERDARKEERFYWIFSCAFLFDVIALKDINGFFGSFLILLQIIFLIGCARICGVEEIEHLLRKVYEILSKKCGSKS